MKPLYFTIIFYCIFINTANAQLDKGFWLTGGDASFTTNAPIPNTSTSQINSTTEIAPIIGYFFFDKFSAGLQTDITIFHQKKGSGLSGTDDVPNSYLYSFGPYIRYYLLNKEKMVNFFVEGDYAYEVGVFKGLNVPTNTTKNQKFNFIAGPEFFFTQSVGLEFTLGYYYENLIGSKSGDKGFQMGIGFMIHLERDD